MAIKVNITPTGLTDGVNTLYTLPSQAASVLNVYVGTVPYFSFVHSGNTITLTDAPVDPVIVTYIETATDITASTGSTVETIFTHLTDALGTGISTRYTDAKKISAIEFARNEIVRIHMPESIMIETLLTFTNAKATLPLDYLYHSKMFSKFTNGKENFRYKKLPINKFDVTARGVWTIKDVGAGREIISSDANITSAYLRYIPKLTPLANLTDLVGLSPVYDYALGYLAAGKVLKDFGEYERGIERYKEGIRLASNAYSLEYGEQEDNAKITSVFEDDEDVMGFGNERALPYPF